MGVFIFIENLQNFGRGFLIEGGGLILIPWYRGGSLRTAEISKNHIKSTKMAVQKLSLPIERSRRKESGKNTKKIFKGLESIEIVFFVCP